MDDGLKLSATNVTSPGFNNSPEEKTDKTAKKKSGCGCFLIGCFALLFLMATPFIGGFIWLASLDEADFGSYAVMLVKNEDFAKGIKEELQKSPDLTAEERNAIIAMYDSFLKNYDSLTPEKQETLNRNIIVVIKKAIENPEAFEQAPPAELLEIMTLLGITPPTFTPDSSGATTPTTPPTGDAYDFDLPSGGEPQNPAPDSGQEPSQFDF